MVLELSFNFVKSLANSLKGFRVTDIYLLFPGLGFLLATFILQQPGLHKEDVGNALEMVFIIFIPNYNLGLCLMDMYMHYANEKECHKWSSSCVAGLKDVNPCCFQGNPLATVSSW